jgi:ABC-2 type transport system ATP-binding protein
MGAEPTMTTPPILEVGGLRKSYGARPVLLGVDLDIAPGEIVGLLGPNGAGKTTLVSILAGLIDPEAGRVMIGSIDALKHPHKARRLLGLAPQETGMYPTLTCRQNLQFFAELAGLRGRHLRGAVDSVAEALQLGDLLDRRAQHLSGGERRRLHTALALVNRPALVVLDEPTTGADVRTRAQLLQFVQDLAADGSAVLYSTHYLTEIEQLTASVVILDQGRVIARGSVAQLVAAHATDIVELTFAGPVPPLLVGALGASVETEGSVLRVRTHEPGRVTASILGDLGARASELRSLKVVQPSLESVYLQLTGRRYHPEIQNGAAHVA